MKRALAFLRRHLNTWDEICFDEAARLRTNTMLCIFAVSCFFLVMLISSLVARRLVLVGFTGFMLAICILLLFIQLFSRKYRPLIAWLFGLMAMGMCLYLLYSGGLDGYSFLWLYLVPLVAIMVVPLKGSILYNAILVASCVVLLRGPTYAYLEYAYAPAFRALFPISILFVALLGYLAELVRYRTQKRLVATAAELQSFAFSDPLTGAYNRHALAAQLGSLEQDAYGLSFAMLDLDFFKSVNDTYGHFTGDEMLCHVVRLIKEGIPPNALLYRWGGEEFLIVLKTADSAALWSALECIRKNIQARPMQMEGKEILITVSIGGKCAEHGEKIEDCIKQADECLYQAKIGGRNRVILHGEQ